MREGILYEGSTYSRAAIFCIGFQVDATDMSCPVAHLNYRLSDRSSSPRNYEYTISLQTTKPHLGGLRWWFTCPLCRRRAQKLYHPPGGDRFGCRDCHKLTYASRSHDPLERSQERARAIRLRLGGSASIADLFPFKPKGMWRKTYERLWQDYQHQYEGDSLLP